MTMRQKPIKAHPNSPLAKIAIKMLEDKRMVSAYHRGEVTKEELEANGIRLVIPF